MASRLLFYNRGSGKSAILDEHRDQLLDSNTKAVDLSDLTDLFGEISLAVRHGCTTVIAAGGDGTVNAIVNALMKLNQSERPRLAILPLGTANDFAGTLSITDDIQSEIASINQGRYEPIDVVQITSPGFEQYYANIAAGGNSVRVSEQLTTEIKEAWGAFCYIRGAVNVLGDMHVYHVVADLDGEQIETDSWGVLIANGRTTAGRIAVAPQASPSDGLLDVIIIRDGNALDMVEIVSKTLLSSFLECEQVIFRQVKQLKLHSIPNMRFTLDGEVIDHEPVSFRVIPSAIEMYVGEAFVPNVEPQQPRESII